MESEKREAEERLIAIESGSLVIKKEEEITQIKEQLSAAQSEIVRTREKVASLDAMATKLKAQKRALVKEVRTSRLRSPDPTRPDSSSTPSSDGRDRGDSDISSLDTSAFSQTSPAPQTRSLSALPRRPDNSSTSTAALTPKGKPPAWTAAGDLASPAGTRGPNRSSKPTRSRRTTAPPSTLSALSSPAGGGADDLDTPPSSTDVSTTSAPTQDPDFWMEVRPWSSPSATATPTTEKTDGKASLAPAASTPSTASSFASGLSSLVLDTAERLKRTISASETPRGGTAGGGKTAPQETATAAE